MNNCNYTIFEILKYKIDFLECIEYSLPSYTIKEEEIKERLSLLNHDFKDGMYKEIVSTLFTSYKKLNEPIRVFLKNYNLKKIIKINSKKSINKLLKYNETLIDCFETFNYIINSFLEEEQIIKLIDEKVLNLINVNNNYFDYFLFFNCYNIFLEFSHDDFKYTQKDIKRTVQLLNYCNKNNKFKKELDVLKTEDSDKIYKELEALSKKCSELEQKQVNDLKEFINIINKEIHK